MKHIVFTGPPWAGKSTVADRLAAEGIPVVFESETSIVRRLTGIYGAEETGAWILDNYYRFKSMVARRQERLERIASDGNDILIYDRSAIDWIAYCRLRGSKVPPLMQKLADGYNFEHVLLFQMVDGFDERREQGRVMTIEEAIQLQGLIEDEYRSRGYDLVTVPPTDVDSRVRLVRERLQLESVS